MQRAVFLLRFLAGAGLLLSGGAARRAEATPPKEAYTLYFRVDGLSRIPGHALYCRTQRGLLPLYPRQRYEILPTAYGGYQFCLLLDKNLQTRKRTRLGYLDMEKLAQQYALPTEESLGRYFVLVVDGVRDGRVVYHTAPWPRHEAVE